MTDLTKADAVAALRRAAWTSNDDRSLLTALADALEQAQEAWLTDGGLVLNYAALPASIASTAKRMWIVPDPRLP